MPEKINPEWAAQEIIKILRHAQHSEDAMAHDAEDDLYAAVLTHIANGTADNPRGCAEAAIWTKNIKFSRWFE